MVNLEPVDTSIAKLCPIAESDRRLSAALLTPRYAEPEHQGSNQIQKGGGEKVDKAISVQTPTALKNNIKFYHQLSKQLINYSQLWKSRLSFLVVFTALGSYYCVIDRSKNTKKNVASALCLGTFCQSAMANTLNEVWELERDKLMTRTKYRPLPDGRMGPLHALAQGTIMGAAGTYILWEHVNPATALLGALNIFVYAAVYTPMKVFHWSNTWIGTFNGSVPPLMGVAAATDQLQHPTGVFMFSLMYFWQITHFMSICYKCKGDYDRAGYKMLSISNPTLSASMAVVHSVALFPLCWALPFVAKEVPMWFIPVSTWINYRYMLKPSWGFRKGMNKRTDLENYQEATTLFWGTLKHLPLLFGVSMVAFNWNPIVDKTKSLISKAKSLLL